MTLFTSDRERRLWLWTLVVLVGIYSTLGIAGTLAEALEDQRRLVDNTFMLGLVLVLGAIFTQRVRTRAGWAELGVWLGIAAVYLLVLLRVSIPAAERTHLVEYSVVAALIYEALSERASQGRRVPAPMILTVVLTGLLGLLDESIQALIPNRVFDFIDVGFNTLAAVMAAGSSAALAWVRRWKSR